MKILRLNHLYLKNFGMHKEFAVNLAHRTFISGQNACGKSTLKKALQFVLNLKDDNGKEITGVRIHDNNGELAADGETVVELILSFDGAEYVLKKTLTEKRNKAGAVTGNDVKYYINDIAKKAAEYDDFLRQLITDEICINPSVFFNGDTTKRRGYVEKLTTEIQNDDIIKINPEFEILRADLSVGSVDEIRKKYNAAVKKLNNSINFELPAKLAEMKKLLSLGMTADEIDNKISEMENHTQNSREISKEIAELKIKLAEIEKSANAKNIKKRQELFDATAKLLQEAYETEREINLKKSQFEKLKTDCDETEKMLLKAREAWKEANSLKLDENALNCGFCGQPLPQEKKTETIQRFEAEKKSQMDKAASDGEEYKKKIEALKTQMRSIETALPTLQSDYETKKGKAQRWKTEISEIPIETDLSQNAEYVSICDELEQKQNEASAGMDVIAKLNELQNEKSYLKRISELESEIRDTAQNLADVEKKVSILNCFSKAKNEAIEKSVNNMFDYIKFKLFEPQLNGEMKNVCAPMVDGESYDRNLNTGAKILANIDICRGFQRKFDVCAPIIVDDCESLDEWRLPECDNQLIIIRRTDDKELIIRQGD